MNLVVIPTYQERETITVLLDALLAREELSDLDVLVVDDSSPDGTGGVVLAHPEHGRRVHLLSRAGKEGLGAAYRAGFAWALERGYAAVVQMDADGSHPVEAVGRLLAGLDEADVVIGSRYVDGGSTVGWTRHRRLVSRGGNAYVRAVLALPVHDATAGFRAFRAEVLPRVLAGPAPSNGYCFQVETTWHAHQQGLRLREVPIAFTDRTVGESKMSPAIVAEALVRVLQWRVEDALEQARRARTARTVSAARA